MDGHRSLGAQAQRARSRPLAPKLSQKPLADGGSQRAGQQQLQASH